MSVKELSPEQLTELKQDYLCKIIPNPSWGELAVANELVPDSVVFSEYAGFLFSNDDFSCSAGM